MTQEQFKDIQERLAKWREERGLSVEDQQANFEVNYTKELVEYFEAYRDNNEYEMIDALCDMIIVSINSGAIRGSKDSCLANENLTIPLVWSEIQGLLFELDKIGYDPYLCLLETIKELDLRTGSWSEEEGKWIKDDGAYTLEEAKESLLEIYDDVKEFNEDDKYWWFACDLYDGESIGRRIKKWYKADYSKCKND